MAPELRIVPATESDLPVILELIRALADYEKLSAACVATEEKLRETLFGSRPYSTFLAQPLMYLEDIFVKPHLRGKGIGSALLKDVARIAVERNCGLMEWEVLDWNEPSIEFYKKLGAQPMNDWTKYRLTGDSLKRVASPLKE